jgi:tetratricopeptide (TPR) repeat protein
MTTAYSLAAELPNVLKEPVFQHFYNLEFDQALSLFRDRATREPDSPEAHNQVAQVVIFRAMHRAGLLDTSTVNEKNPFLRRPKLQMTPEDEKLFLDSLNRALNLSGARLKQNPNDVAALYSSGVAYGLRANYAVMVKKAWIAALRDFTQARKLHIKVTELDPHRTDALLIQGLHAYIAGSLGFPWKQLGFLAGVHGDKHAGIDILRQVAESGEYNKPDAAALLEAILRREHRPAEAIPYMNDLIRWFPRNYILRMELARLYMDIGDKAKSLAVVREVEHLARTRAPGFGMVSDARLRDLRQEIESR